MVPSMRDSESKLGKRGYIGQVCELHGSDGLNARYRRGHQWHGYERVSRPHSL